METVYVSYAVTEFFLIVFTVTILLRLNLNFGSEAEVRKLKHNIYAYLAVLTADVICNLATGGVIAVPRGVVALFDAIYLCAVLLECYFWCQFIKVRLQTSLPEDGTRLYSIVMILPLSLGVALDLVSMGTGWIFYLDSAGQYCHGAWYPLHVGFCYFYLVGSMFAALTVLVGAKDTLKRRECLLYASYILLPLLSWWVSGLLGIDTAPILSLSIFMIVHMLFLTLQDGQIFNDGLTGLNNRRRLDGYLKEQLAAASEKKPVGVMMMDLNRFKLINDTYGHVEGDKALKLAAQALKKIAAAHNVFVARYGGDEFCIVIPGTEDKAGQVAAELQ